MIVIRDAALQDIPSLQKLFLQLGYQTDAESLQQRINEADNNLTMLVAEAEADICGVIVVNYVAPVHETGLWALISALVIDESARGAGVGQQLLVASERIAADKKCSQIELSSSERRVRAHKFYESNGYKEVRKRFVKLLADPPPAD